MLYVKPARPGTTIYCPDRGYSILAQQGELVPKTPWWDRQLILGEVVECTKAEIEKILLTLHPHASAPDPKQPDHHTIVEPIAPKA